MFFKKKEKQHGWFCSIMIIGNPVDVFINPSQRHVRDILKKSNRYSVRVGVSKGNIYIWDGDYLHTEVSKKLNITFKQEFTWTKGDEQLQTSPCSRGNVNKVKKQMKLLFPAITHIWNGMEVVNV